MLKFELGRTTCSSHPSTWEAKAGELLQVEISLGYRKTLYPLTHPPKNNIFSSV